MMVMSVIMMMMMLTMIFCRFSADELLQQAFTPLFKLGFLDAWFDPDDDTDDLKPPRCNVNCHTFLHIFPQVRLYGSSLSGFGLKSANVNLDLQITADMKPHLVLITALEVLQENPEYTQVTEEFTAKIPLIKFRTVASGLACELSLSNHQAFQTS